MPVVAHAPVHATPNGIPEAQSTRIAPVSWHSVHETPVSIPSACKFDRLLNLPMQFKPVYCDGRTVHCVIEQKPLRLHSPA